MQRGMSSRKWLAAAVAAAVALTAAPARAQETGTVQGTVTLVGDAGPVHGALVLVVGTGATALTEDDGTYALEGVPAGSHEVLAQREHLTADRQMIAVGGGEVVTVDFELAPSPIHEQVTVTGAAGGTETTFEAFNAVTTLDSYDLVRGAHGSLGEALQNEPGIASRSFGPGSSRPIIRGFDGDRVLILDDGMRTGDLSSQSGDHGVTMDPNAAERIEIVRGPATLLYGSNAVGGLVNVISPQETMHESMFQGTRAQLSTDVGSANAQAGVNLNLQHAQGGLRVWAGGSTRRSGDYDTPEGTVANSGTELSNARAGAGYDNGTFFASGGFTFEQGRYGVPFADEFHGAHDVHDVGHGDEDDDHEGEEEGIEIDLASRRQVGRFDLGLRNLSNRLIEGLRVTMNVVDWGHDELEVEDGFENIGTSFANRTYIVRAEFDQQQTERLSGRFGAWTQVRDFEATGFEALAPRTDLTSMAAFAYEEVDFGPVRLQFGGRIERNSYRAGDRMIGLDSEDRDRHDRGDEDDHDEDDHDEDDHGEDDHDDDHEDDHGEDDHDDDHGEDDHDDDHGEDDHNDDHGEDDHDDDHGEDDHDDDLGEDDHDDDHGEDDHDDDHGEDDHDDDHGEDDHDDDHGEDDHDDDHGEDDHDDDHEDEVLIPVPDPRDRAFLGASGSIGVHVGIGERSAFVANFTSTHRAPALEELYNYGPHVGNLSFEVGNPDLRAEETLGLDVSLRTRSNRVRGELNAYVYNIDGFIFGDYTGRTLDSLPVLNFVQGDSRFRGMDARGSVRLGGRAWATVGLGYVDARLTETNEPLPRIPPLRGTLQLDVPYGDFTVSPQLMYAARQDAIFRGETETDGYSVLNVIASYTWSRRHAAHVLTFTGYNLTNTLYRNHTSFIKDLAPEMGRGIKVGYSVRFF